MGTETLLIIVLSLLVVLLGVLYIRRVTSEKDHESIVDKLNLVEFAEFLRSNSVDGSIQSVAGKVSRLLVKSFGCEKIIFLRKKRGSLELNFYHGIVKFNRKDFHLQYEEKIGEKLSEHFLPMKLEKLKPIVSAAYYQRLKNYGVDMYFPIFWRNNLYGIYFIKSNLEVRTPEFTLMVASLAQSLSAAYHIKWHESKLSNLEKRLSNTSKANSVATGASDLTNDAGTELLQMVNIRDTNQLVPKIIRHLSNDLHFNSYSLMYLDENEEQGIRTYSMGIGKEGIKTEAKELNRLSHAIKGRGIQSIEKLLNADTENNEFLNELREHHLDYITEFDIVSKRPCLLAFSGKKLTGAVKSQLSSYRQIASNLLENAEAYGQAERMSYTDALSELSNLRYMYKRLEEEINRASRHSRPLAFIMFDIDELKNVNDNHGHLAGDALIKQVGQVLKKTIRVIDVVARYGGDEFCALMPEADEETCVKFMNRLMTTIAATGIEIPGHDTPIHCTISIGAALYPVHADQAQKLVHAADMALLEAKSQGRNNFVIYSSEMAKSAH